MKDFKGQQLNLGDTVIYTFESGGVLHEGVIEKMTQHSLTIRHAPDTISSYTNNKGHTTSYTIKGTNRLLNASSRVFKLDK